MHWASSRMQKKTTYLLMTPTQEEGLKAGLVDAVNSLLQVALSLFLSLCRCLSLFLCLSENIYVGAKLPGLGLLHVHAILLCTRYHYLHTCTSLSPEV